VLDHFAPLVRDAVIAGADRDDLTMLVFPDVEACRRLCPDLPADAPAAAVLGDVRVRSEFAKRLASLAKDSPGSSTRIARALLLETPPSMDVGEATDKGSINQRMVLKNRAPLVEELYTKPYSARVISA